jgi:hypothetical protein
MEFLLFYYRKPLKFFPGLLNLSYEKIAGEFHFVVLGQVSIKIFNFEMTKKLLTLQCPSK